MIDKQSVVDEIAETHHAIESGEIDPAIGELLLQNLEIDLQDAVETEELLTDINTEIANTRQACADGNISKRVAVSMIRTLSQKANTITG